MGKETLDSMLDELANESLIRMILSSPVEKEKLQKVRIRPMMLKGKLVFQAEELAGRQAFHKNLSLDELKTYMKDRLEHDFRQADVASPLGSAVVLVSKKGTMTVKVKRNRQQTANRLTAGKEAASQETANQETGEGRQRILAESVLLQHNRQKRYVLQEGVPVPFLVDLGVMTAEGKIVRSRYDKFRQINRFLEFVEDILPKLPKDRRITIIDFGCGKSYLTFAMYYYLHTLKEYDIQIIGLDLKQDVIDRCNEFARIYGFDHLAFYHGDIASYEGVDQVDMVVTLHACDTATDYALAKAVRWNASVILSVPCCQHELNRQIKNDLLAPAFRYGLIKERMAALYTDAIRAEVLENHGYRTQILEFIDMEHTPKNILIRAVKEGKPRANGRQLREMMEFLHADNTLVREVGIL